MLRSLQHEYEQVEGAEQPGFLALVENRHYVVGRFSAWIGRCSPHSKLPPDLAPDTFILCLPIDLCDAGQRVTTGAQGLLANLTYFEEFTPRERGHYIVLAFEKPAMLQQARELLGVPFGENVEFDRLVDLSTARGSCLAKLGRLVWNSLDLPETDRLPRAAIERLFQATMIALLQGVPNNCLSRMTKSISPAVPWRVKRAIDYMHANLSRSLTVSVIAREVGTSARALQGDFQQFKATTPLSYLRTIRLEAVRKTLLGDESARSIAEVARKAGFTHMGRFAAAYYEAFGETPSKTIRAR